MIPNVSSLDADVAQKLAGTLHPDIILCDVRLKGSSGLGLCRKILERDPAAKVVLLSAYDLVCPGANPPTA